MFLLSHVLDPATLLLIEIAKHGVPEKDDIANWKKRCPGDEELVRVTHRNFRGHYRKGSNRDGMLLRYGNVC